MKKPIIGFRILEKLLQFLSGRLLWRYFETTYHIQGESASHGGGHGDKLRLLAEATYPPGSGSAPGPPPGPSPLPFASSLAESGKPSPKLGSGESARAGPGAWNAQQSSSATFSRTAPGA